MNDDRHPDDIIPGETPEQTTARHRAEEEEMLQRYYAVAWEVAEYYRTGR